MQSTTLGDRNAGGSPPWMIIVHHPAIFLVQSILQMDNVSRAVHPLGVSERK